MTDYRLPRVALPTDYEIDLDVSPKKSTFTGKVLVNLTVVEPTTRLELHARSLKVLTAVVVSKGKKQKAKITTQKKRETVELTLAKPVPKGKIEVLMTFTGRLDPSMHGLYLAKDGSDRSLVTQCEATDARAIFPCLDEPEFKATLRWIIRTDADLTVVTNGVFESVKKERGRVVHRFKKTRVISTYLAAITVGRYEATKPRKVNGIPCRVLVGAGKLEQATFAEEVTDYVLPWYEKYFGLPYHYQKLDQVGVAGFDAGAMENIGAIFYRQSRLLMQPGQTSWQTQKSIAEVIAHEIAHQWFGNRVTMKWWDDLWLNEAFATWVSYKAIDIWRPDWRLWDDYQSSKEAALHADALVNTHPIYTEVKSPAEATELFDVITYSKGGAVLRMAERFIGPEVFQRGIQIYMNRHKDKNATGADLWGALSEASGEPINELMGSWVTQSGFPLVKVELVDGGQKLRLSQRRFFSSPELMQQANEQLWDIPVNLRYADQSGVHERRFLFKEREQIVALEPNGELLWLYANTDTTGFYRVDLNPDLIARVIHHGLGKLSASERVGLIEDQWALVRNGCSTSDRFLDLLVAFVRETDYVVLRTLSNRVDVIHRDLVKDADHPRFAELLRHLFTHHLQHLGVAPRAGESMPDAVKRANVMRVLGDVARSEEVLQAAESSAEQERVEPTSVEPNLAGIVVALAALRGDKKRFETYLKTYRERQKKRLSPELQDRYLDALPAFVNGKLPEEVLKLCLDGTIPQEELCFVFISMMSRKETQRLSWAFLKKNWLKIGPRIGGMGLSRLVEATGRLPSDLRSDIEKFFKKNEVPEAARALKKALEAMSLRDELVGREGGRLSSWLAAMKVTEAALS